MTKLEILETLKAAGENGSYLPAKEAKRIAKDGLIEINETVKDADGKIAARITAKGAEFLASLEQPKKEAVPQMQYAIMNVPMPEVKRKGGAGRPSKYPFDKLEVGQMFFVPSSKDQPDPAKTLGSVVTSANRRFANLSDTETKTNRKGETVPKLVYTKFFVLRAHSQLDEASGEYVHGAGVWRKQ